MVADNDAAKVPATSKDKIEAIIKCLQDVNFRDTEAAINNLTVIAREQGPAVVFEHPNFTDIIRKEIDSKQHANLPACFRLIGQLTKMSAVRTLKLMETFSVDYLIDTVCYSEQDDLLIAFQSLIQSYIDALAGVQEKALKVKQNERQDQLRTKSVSESLYNKVYKKIDEDIYKENSSHILTIVVRILKRSSSYIISAKARDTLLSLLLCNVDPQILNLGVKLVEENCIQNLLDIASEVEEIKTASSMNITSTTHTLVSAVLEKIYSCHDHDKVREIFREQVQEYLNAKLRNPDMNDKTRAAKIFTVLLKGPSEIGNSCIGQNGMVEMLIAMSTSDDQVQQIVALDAIIAASMKKDKCAAFAKFGESTLNKLRDSKNEEVRLRALVCLSKLSSVGSTDAQIRPLGQQANINFAKDCRVILSKQDADLKLKTYAIGALAFLSFDGDVKEDLVRDKACLKALFEYFLSNKDEGAVIYSILNIFVNVTNSYFKEEKPPELVELAKFAKQHIPQEHPKDSPAVLKQRICELATTEIVATLVCMEPKTNNEREMLGRILNAMAEHEEVRGRIVQQGAVKLLLSIAAQGKDRRPEEFVVQTAQALARLGITINPEFVYPGQKMLAAIRHIRKLLHPDCTALQNFEALLALTNIAQASNEARTHILRDNGFSQIESLMFEDHVMIRRAAVECIVNLIKDEEVIKLYEADNDRVKFLVVLCQDEDLDTAKAASGALATLAQYSEKACKKIFTAKEWSEILGYLLTHSDLGIVHRAAVIVRCIVHCDDVNLPKQLFESKVLEVLTALSALNTPLKEIFDECLEKGKELKLIST